MENKLTPVIRVLGGGLSNEATLAEDALINASVEVYQRGEKLVRPVIDEADATKGRLTKIARLFRIEIPYMQDLLCRNIVWEKYDYRKDDYIKINPPQNVTQLILNRYGEWKFRKVVGVITSQTLRPDGSLLSKAGYDDMTKLLLIDPPEMPYISESPTKDEAINSLNLLDSLLNEFPFVSEADRSVALSALITPVVRGAFTVAPMHVIRAPSPGSGKSFLLDVATAISTGQPCPVISAGKNEEELEKRLGALLMTGQSIISIDNVNGNLGGDALCQIIERPSVDIRVLGKSEIVKIETRSTIFANGNNISLLEDVTRRAILCTLDPNLERPELKQFETNPFDTILLNRGKYIAAALTIVRAYISAGKPNTAPKLASFEDWSDNVRSALIWLGKEDPLKTMESIRNEDPSLQNMIALFSALRATFGCGNELTAAEIKQEALIKKDSGTHNHSELYEALINAVGDKSGFIGTKELGKWLGRHKGRIAMGIRLDGKSDNHGHAIKWSLTDCAVKADKAVNF